MPAVAKAMRADVLDRSRRGVGPDGKLWAPTAEGELPLQGVARDLSVSVVGTTAVLTLEGVHARHSLGRVRGGIARPVLPTKAVPASMERAVRAVITKELGRVLEVDGGEE
jgi:hypothetical protein